MELLEASQYGLLERIPVLLTSVSVDAANAVRMSDFPISEVIEWFIARANPSSPVYTAYECPHMNVCICDHLRLV